MGQVNPKKRNFLLPATGCNKMEQPSSNQGSLNLNSLLKAPLKLAAVFNHFVHLDPADRCAQEERKNRREKMREGGQMKNFNLGIHKAILRKVSENNTVQLSFPLEHKQSYPVWGIKVP